MAATTVNIVSTDTYANLKAGEPYGSDYYGQFVFASDFDIVYRVNNAGSMVSLSKVATITQLNVTGATITASSLPESPTYLAVYRDRLRQFPTEYSVPLGGGQIDLVEAAADESFYIEFIPKWQHLQ